MTRPRFPFLPAASYARAAFALHVGARWWLGPHGPIDHHWDVYFVADAALRDYDRLRAGKEGR